MGLLYGRCSVGIYCKGTPETFMPRLHKEWGLRDALGRSCHTGLSMFTEARKLDGCHHDAGEDEGGAKEGDGAQHFADQEEREDGRADRLERRAKPVVSAGT